MPDLGTRITDARMRELDKRLQEVYARAYNAAVDKEITALQSLWAYKTPPGATEEQDMALRIAHMKRLDRETRVSANIAAEIAKGGNRAESLIQDAMTDTYGINLDWSRYSIDRSAGALLDWHIYDRRQLRVLMSEGQSPFTKIAYRNLGRDRVIVQRLQNELMQATILGESQRYIIRRVQAVTGQSVSQARRVAQTERTRVQTQGRMEGISEAAEMGIEMSKQWLSRMDNRVRDDHAEVSGDVVDYDETFSNGLMYPGDPSGDAANVINCRCVLKPLVKNVPESVRRLREQFDQSMGFDEWRESRGG